MRRLRREAHRRVRADDGVLPLINVVFLLLVFFMVAGRLSSADPFRIDPARAGLEGSGPDGAPVLLVGADGRLALDGAEIARGALPAALDGATRLRIRADGAADSLALVALLAELRAAGVSDARLMVERRP